MARKKRYILKVEAESLRKLDEDLYRIAAMLKDGYECGQLPPEGYWDLEVKDE